jgi:predicted KAP-like P-loop ATPase
VKGSTGIKIIPDEPASEDALEFQTFVKYSKKLADIIRYSTPKFAVGIFGEWGTGKTTMMKMIEKQLTDNYPSDVLPVWFNAWKYEREKYLAAVPLLRTIKITLNKYKNSKSGNWQKVEKALGKTFNAFVGSADLTITAGASKINLEKFADLVRANGYTRIDGKKILLQKHATDDLEESLQELREKNDNDPRIVIFIDDLDRCHPIKALEVLDSIKTFFDIEGIVYVIGMNVDSIDPIINQKYKEASDVKGKGLEYLQKIVQLQFNIPSWKEQDITQSVSKIISKELKESELFDQFKNNIPLIVKAVQKNPREEEVYKRHYFSTIS